MDVAIIEFDGEIEDFPLLIQSVDGLIESGMHNVVIDLEPLGFINSAALGYLVRTQKTLKREGGGLALCRVTPGVLNILNVTELDRMLPAFADENAAVAHLSGDAKEVVSRHAWR
jgi:anti-anti-sigma factor